ncbi:hypothetical protein GCM10009744_38900 [Kribbella alba]|uniref:Uncharacterized protein n=1 Tax=Kribbella alba TaxID=190197 RepID=A0ABN2FGB1_9ACTN
MKRVYPAASLLTPFATVQYGAVAVPGPASEQPAAVLSTYREVVAACASDGNARIPAGSKARAHKPEILVRFILSG